MSRRGRSSSSSSIGGYIEEGLCSERVVAEFDEGIARHWRQALTIAAIGLSRTSLDGLGVSSNTAAFVFERIERVQHPPLHGREWRRRILQRESERITRSCSSRSRPSLAALPLPRLSLPLAAALYHTSTEHKAPDGTTLSDHLRRSRQHHEPRATTLRLDGVRSCIAAQLAVYCVGLIARRCRVQPQDVQSNEWKTWGQLYRRGFIETDFILLRAHYLVSRLVRREPSIVRKRWISRDARGWTIPLLRFDRPSIFDFALRKGIVARTNGSVSIDGVGLGRGGGSYARERAFAKPVFAGPISALASLRWASILRFAAPQGYR